MPRSGSLSIDTWMPDETECMTREQILKARGYPVKVKRKKKVVVK